MPFLQFTSIHTAGEPLVQSDRRILEDGSDLEREFLLGMVAVAAIEPRLFKIGDLLGTAVWAAHLPSGQRTAIMNLRQFSKSLKY